MQVHLLIIVTQKRVRVKLGVPVKGACLYFSWLSLPSQYGFPCISPFISESFLTVFDTCISQVFEKLFILMFEL